ncbi:13119_t:CDS:1, partial [Acaulospora morrowiae]
KRKESSNNWVVNKKGLFFPRNPAQRSSKDPLTKGHAGAVP